MKGEKVYVIDYQRTPFSRARPSEPERDNLNSLRMDVALSELIKEGISRTGIRADEIGDIITGSAYQRDENWTYGGRHPVFLSDLPFSVPAMAVDRACASSMNAISIGSTEIAAGISDIVIAGGIEHMTHVPRLSNKLCTPLIEDDHYVKYRMKESYNMGLTAENLAKESGISREEMDQYSVKSHKLAQKSVEDGFFKGEIHPVEVTVNGAQSVVDRDQSIRPDTNLELMRKLPPAFTENGLITAGNSSPLNSGASMVILASEKVVRETGITPLSRIISFGWAGVPPYLMGTGPIPATEKALNHAQLSRDDIDVWEINEAFAVVVLNAIRELEIDPSRVNMHGGAIAIGHPLGATGARLVGTASRILAEKKKDKAVATLCVGGGQGFTTVIERI